MGTRSLTHFKNEYNQNETILTMYRQYDGYPEGHGAHLKEAYDLYKDKHNGFNDLIGLMFCHIKDRKPLNVYIYPINSKRCGEEYVYTLYQDSDDNKIKMNIDALDYDYERQTIWRGDIEGFSPEQCGEEE